MAPQYEAIHWLNYSNYEDLRFYEIGHQKCDPGYDFGPIIRDKFILHYVVRGKGHLEMDGQKLFVSFAPTEVHISGVTENPEEIHKWLWNEEMGMFTYSITKERLLIHLNYATNENFKLESSTEHRAFSEAITGMTIKTTVSKTVTP